MVIQVTDPCVVIQVIDPCVVIQVHDPCVVIQVPEPCVVIQVPGLRHLQTIMIYLGIWSGASRIRQHPYGNGWGLET